MTIKSQPLLTLALAGIGLLARVYTNANFGHILKDRVEISTPISSWKRAFEAVHLWNLGLNPYSGDIFHEYPLSLVLYKFISTNTNACLIFSLADTLTAVILQLAVYKLLTSCHKQDESNAEKKSLLVLLSYLFSPIAVLSCAGLSTTTFTNFLLSSILLAISISSCKSVTCILAAALSCNNLHFSCLVIPIILSNQFLQHIAGPDTKPYYKHENFHSSITKQLVTWLVTVVTLLIASYLIMGNSWVFLRSTYWFSLKVQDLTPNIGMFWYFFTEVFENFLDFFTWTFQINSFIHVVPLCIYYRKDPIFGLYVVLLSATIFQPYPSLSNIGLVSSLTFQWLDSFKNLKRVLVVSSTCVVCLALCPIFWHQWIVMGTGNANFYFGVTLAFVTAIILFMVDICQAYNNTAKISASEMR